MPRQGEPFNAKTVLAAALVDKGYRDSAMLGPFVSRGGEQQYAVTIHEPGGEGTRMLRGSFAQLRKAIGAPSPPRLALLVPLVIKCCACYDRALHHLVTTTQ